MTPRPHPRDRENGGRQDEPGEQPAGLPGTARTEAEDDPARDDRTPDRPALDSLSRGRARAARLRARARRVQDRRLGRWLTPGIGVKRWFFLFALCSLIGAFSFLHLTWTGPLHFAATRWILYLNNLTDPQVVPLWVVGMVVTLLALAGAVTSMVMLNRSVLKSTGQDPSTTLDQLHTSRTLSRGPRVVAVGGGTGLSRLLAGLKEHSGNITALVTVADDGGSSGRLRESLDMIAPGDLTDCYAALSDSPVLARLLLHRFGRGDGISGHTFGNLLLATLSEEQGGLSGAMQDVHEVLKVRGKVYPATTAPATLVAELSDGRVIRGESAIAEQLGRARIERVRLDPPELPALDAVLEAIESADLLVLGPGSLYTSIIPALLVPEVAAAIRASLAPLVYVAAVMTETGETDDLTLADHDHAILTHLGRRPDLLLVNSAPVPAGVQARYALEGARVLRGLGVAAELRPRVTYAPLLDSSGRAHHDPKLLARALVALYRRSG